MKRCHVVCDTPAGVHECTLELPDGATVAAALEAARAQLRSPGIDWEHAATGIYGRACARSHVPEDGDRIELYRALLIDPRESRRARARAQRRSAVR